MLDFRRDFERVEPRRSVDRVIIRHYRPRHCLIKRPTFIHVIHFQMNADRTTQTLNSSSTVGMSRCHCLSSPFWWVHRCSLLLFLLSQERCTLSLLLTFEYSLHHMYCQIVLLLWTLLPNPPRLCAVVPQLPLSSDFMFSSICCRTLTVLPPTTTMPRSLSLLPYSSVSSFFTASVELVDASEILHIFKCSTPLALLWYSLSADASRGTAKRYAPQCQ